MTMKEDQNVMSFDSKSFTDKNVMECDLPELEVCYKDIDCQILKDICVDEGRPERDINVIESFNDEKAGLLFSELPNDKVHLEASDNSSQGCTNDLSANQCGRKEVNDGGDLVSEGNLESSLDNSFDVVSSKHCALENLVSEGNLESSLDNSFDELSAKHCDPENSAHIGEANCGAMGKADTDSSDVTQPSDQILNGKTDSESPDASSAEAGGRAEDIKASSLPYNSKVESRIITFNFEERSDESANAAITENVEEQLVNIEDGNSDGCSVQHAISSSETAHEKSPESKDVSNHDDDPVPISSDENVQVVEPKVPQHERSSSSGQASVVNQLYRDEGEMSFSAGRLITFSGPIAYSGSLSHRSDGSTTSTKSFAFPVLQSEWNSSPVRMAKADGRHFRKHKSWRAGLLCCRF